LATTASLHAKPTHAELSSEGLQHGGESDDLLKDFDLIQPLMSDASLNLPLLQYSPRRDGAENIGFNGGYSESSLSTTTSTAMTPAADEGFLSFLQSTWGNNTPSDLNFSLDNFSYGGGKEVQMRIFSPAPTMTPTMVPPTSTPSVPLSPMAVPTRIPSPFSNAVISGHFTRNSFQTTKRQVLVTMIVDMIRAYPRMMMRRETFPPFVHANFPAEDHPNDHSRLPENLTNCMGIAQLFAVCNDDTRLFVWGTILAEMRRFRTRASTFNKYEAVSALQACLLYLIMRAIDVVPQQAKRDYEMLLIYQVCLPLSFMEPH
jgi:hypothetical protein